MTPNEMQNKLNEAVMNIQSLQDELDRLKQADTYFPESGEVVWVSDDLETWEKRIFVKFLGFKSSPYKCVWENKSNTTKNYLLGKNYITSDWAYCRRLDGEIIPFGRDKHKDPDYTHLLPDGYEFCKEEEAEKWVKVELKGNFKEVAIGNVSEGEGDHWKPYYRPIRKIQYHVAVHEAVTVTDNEIITSQVSEYYQPLFDILHKEHNVIATISELDEIIRTVNGLDKSEPNPYAVDWTNAPDWADSHAFDEDGSGFWYGMSKGVATWWERRESSKFTLPSNLDWTKSKTTRP